MIRFGLIALLAVAFGCAAGAEGNESGSDTNGGGGALGGAGGGSTRGGKAGTGATPSTGGAPTSGGGSAGSSHAGEPAAAGGDDDIEGGTGGSGATSAAGGKTTGTAGMSAAYGGAGGANAAGGATARHTNPLSQTLIDAFVKAHNDARAGKLNPQPNPPLPPVTWDATLADSAYNYLMKCESSDGGLVDHNANRTKDYAALGGTDSVGENIYASNASSVTPEDAVSSWMSEAPRYVPGDLTSAGHYTQVVWRDSVRIGCAIVNCPSLHDNNTVLCDYAPAGNVSGEKPY